MMTKEEKSSDGFINLAAVKQDRNVYKKRQTGDNIKTQKMYQALKLVDREMKFKDWRFDEISRGYHL